MNSPRVLTSQLDLPTCTALLEVLAVVSLFDNLGELFRDLTPRLRSVVPLDFITLALHNPARNVMALSGWEAADQVREAEQLPTEETASGWVWQHQEALSIQDLQTETRFEPGLGWLRNYELRSYCVLPVTSVHEKIGALGFASKQAHAFPHGDVEFLHAVAHIIALCLDRTLPQATLVAEKQRIRLRLEIQAFSKQTSEQQDIPSFLRLLHQQPLHDFVGIYLFDKSSQSLRLQMADAYMAERFNSKGVTSVESSLAGQAFHSQRVLEFKHSDLIASPLESVKRGLEAGVKSLCLLPLISTRGPLGVLKVASRTDAAFLSEDVTALSEVATVLTSILERSLTGGNFNPRDHRPGNQGTQVSCS